MASKSNENNYKYILAALAVVFFLGSIFLFQHKLYISPDETSNAFFVKSFAKNKTFQVEDKSNQLFDQAIHPRSIKVFENNLVPGSFTGLPFLYGIIVFIFGNWLLPFITPIIAVIAIFCWNKLLQKWFSKEVAFVGTVVSLFHPALWYYSVRGLMHNVLFVSLLIVSIYIFFERPIGYHLQRCKDRIGRLHKWQKNIDLVFVGALLALTLFVRLSETYWVLALIILFVAVEWKKIKIKGLVIFVLAFVLSTIPFLLINNATYGSPFLTGYNLPQVSSLVQQDEVMGVTSSIIFPFGIHLKTATNHIVDYAISLFWWLSILAVLGLPIFLSQKKNKRNHRNYFYVFFALSIWLGFWYGSWTFFDNPDKSQITIANSYIRYWLPIFIMSTPFIASTIIWVSNKTKTAFAKKSVIATFLIFIIGMSINIVFFTGQDSLKNVSTVLSESAEIKKDILSITEPKSIIIVDRADKLFFPDRRVIVPLRSERTFLLMPEIVKTVPLYYYGITFPQIDLDYLNNVQLISGLKIKKLKTYKEESLYKIDLP